VTQTISATPSTGNFRSLLLEITRGSPDFSVGLLRTTSSAAGDLTLDEFKLAMQTGRFDSNSGVVLCLAAVTGATHTVLYNNLAVDEGVNGVLNSVVVAWDKAQTPLYVSDICYARIT
jgi:hypothetical protein